MSSHKRVRSEQSSACTECQRRKGKCSGGRPCTFCAKTGRKCINQPQILRIPLTRKNMDDLHTRCQRLESLLQSLDPSLNLDDLLGSSTASSTSCSRSPPSPSPLTPFNPTPSPVFSQDGFSYSTSMHHQLAGDPFSHSGCSPPSPPPAALGTFPTPPEMDHHFESAGGILGQLQFMQNTLSPQPIDMRLWTGGGEMDFGNSSSSGIGGIGDMVGIGCIGGVGVGIGIGVGVGGEVYDRRRF